jgi:hypothetical protein
LISEEEAFSQEFGWYPLIYVAANESYVDINKVLESPAQEFLHFANFYTRKSYLDTKRIKTMNNK